MSTSGILLFLATALAAGDEPGTAEQLQVESVLVTLIEQVDAPSREPGVLSKVLVQEGDLVKVGAPLARIDDQEVRLLMRRAEIEVENARKQAQDDVKVRYARNAFELASSELKRALEARKLYRKSVTDSEIDRYRLAVQQAELEIEQAVHDLDVAQHVWQLSENELQIAQNALDRRDIRAPIAGVVVQVNRHRGEWVEPGDPVLRLLRIESLRAEGFLNADEVVGHLSGASVVMRVKLPGEDKAQEFFGKLVFVSPEINPVNGQIRFWAEIENRDLLLRPGMRASMTIDVASARATRSRSSATDRQALRKSR